MSRGDVVPLGVAPTDPLEHERTRLAYAIHDGLTQVVTASVLELDWLSRQTEAGRQDAAEALRTAATWLRDALEDIREVLATLAPDRDPDAPSIEQVMREVIDRWHLPATWSVRGDLHAVPGPVMDAARSVIREGIANAAKHADPGEVDVRVEASPRSVEVSVRDDGRGFDPAGPSRNVGHLGLEMMRRRVAEVNGTLDVRSTPGRGTRLVATLPLIDQGASS